jgi:hypothetical protein
MPSSLSDAELLALAVAQVLLVALRDRWLRFVQRRCRAVPVPARQSGSDKRLVARCR